MAHEYSSEIHDWDLTLRAAWSLVMTGQAAKYVKMPASTAETEFGCYTGSMLLSFCAIESFAASVAFSMPKHERYKGFDYAKYSKTRNFWPKMEILCGAIPCAADQSQEPFKTIEEMRVWRNLLAHASPYEIEKTLIENTTDAPLRLHEPFHGREYTRSVNVESAKRFYTAAYNYIDLVKRLTGIEPRAFASYVVGSNDDS